MPEALIPTDSARIMSLADGTCKMSKSAENDFSRINLLDSPDLIAQKIKRCKTDLFHGLEWDNAERPEAHNLLTIYQAVTNKSKDEILAETGTMKWGTFKPLLTEAVVSHLAPIQSRYHEVVKDEACLHKILRDGRLAAEEVANRSLLTAKQSMGFDIPNDV